MKGIINIRNIAIAAVIIAVIWFVIDYKNTKEAAKMHSNNYQAALTELANKDNAFVQYEFKKTSELQHYIERQDNRFATLEQQLIDANIRLKQVTQIVSTTVSSRDTIVSVIKIDSLQQKVINNQSFSVPIEDTTECFYIKAELIYHDGQAHFVILDKQYNDTINHVAYWERKQWKFLFIKSRLFGKKIGKVILHSNCGSTKTITITKNG